MKYNTRREARAAAESLVKSLHCKHLHTLANALNDALSCAETLERQSIVDGSLDTAAAALELHNSLLYWLNVCESTITDLRASTITHSDGEVHAFGQTWTPAQACAVAKRMTEHAYHAGTHVRRVVELARPKLEGKQIVDLQ